MTEKTKAEIFKELDQKVYKWYHEETMSDLYYYGEINEYFDDFMLIEKAQRYLRQKKFTEEANKLGYDWFLEFIDKHELRQDVAEMCNWCAKGKKENNVYPIKLRKASVLCSVCNQSGEESDDEDIEVEDDNEKAKSEKKCKSDEECDNEKSVEDSEKNDRSEDEEEDENSNEKVTSDQPLTKGEANENKNVVKSKGKKRRLEKDDGKSESNSKKARSDKVTKLASFKSQKPKEKKGSKKSA